METALPFYGLAALTGYSRMATHHHFFKDVAGGALIGVGSSYLLTYPINAHTAVSLTPAEGGAMVNVSHVW
ncbi:hypothetical protein BH11PSE7_BH11PSE7_21330 [soil metagenome]